MAQEMILPGTYITVRDEGLISAGRVASGNIGIVGTAAAGPVNEVKILGSFTEARQEFGEPDPWPGDKQPPLTLVRALEQIYNNGGRTVYAVRVANPDALATATLVLALDAQPAVKLAAKTPGTAGNTIRVKPTGDPAAQLIEIGAGNTSETYPTATADELIAQVQANSTLVTATYAAEGETGPALADLGEAGTPLSGGNDGAAATSADYARGLELLEKPIVNIVLLAGQDAANGMGAALQGHLQRTAAVRRERIGIMGSNGTDAVATIADHDFASDRLIFVAPGLRLTQTDPQTRVTAQVALPGSYMAAAVAGLVAALPVQASPTNKTLVIEDVSSEFSAAELANLVQHRVLAVEKRAGFRVVKGITTATNSAWHQITTRRIVDYAIYGVRSACNPYIGKLNNERVRSAMKATLDAFLTRMVQSEALVSYQLSVTATRAQQIAGQVMVTLTLQPTFSIDFIQVTLYLG